MIKMVVFLCTMINGELHKQTIMDSKVECLKEKRKIEREHITDTSMTFMCDEMKAKVKHDADGNLVVLEIIQDMSSGVHAQEHGGVKSDLKKMEHKGH